MYLSKSQVEIIKNYLKDKLLVKSCFVYGSYARGDAGSESDIDLVVRLDSNLLEVLAREYLHLSDDLSRLLKKKVSIVSEDAVSPYIENFAKEARIVIFNRSSDVEYEDLSGASFDKNSYRDRARLMHIRDSLALIVGWTKGQAISDFISDTKTQSACKRELQVATELVDQLTQSTKDWLSENEAGQDGLENLQLIKLNFQQYFGSDRFILLGIFRSEIPPFLEQVAKYVEGWDKRFKINLGRYFISYLRSAIDEPVRHLITNGEQWAENESRIKLTVDATPIEELTAGRIEQGERNLKWGAAQLNHTRIWDFLLSLCPIFPFC